MGGIGLIQKPEKARTSWKEKRGEDFRFAVLYEFYRRKYFLCGY